MYVVTAVVKEISEGNSEQMKAKYIIHCVCMVIKGSNSCMCMCVN